jgi:uncharacterized protein
MDKVEKRDWVSFENESAKLFGIVHRPLLVKGKRPAIVFCHGFEGNKCGRHRAYVTLAQEFAKSGFVSLRFDYRGSGDSEGEFKDVTLEGEISDTLKAIDLLSEDDQVDPDRICLFGRSLGSVIAIQAAARHQAIKSIALWAPIYSTVFWRELWEASQRNTLTEGQEKALERLHRIPNGTFLSEFFNVDIGKELQTLSAIPLLLIHGEKDSVVPIQQSEMYQKARQRVEGATSFIRLPNTEHDFSDQVEQEMAMRKTYDWFNLETAVEDDKLTQSFEP